MKYCLDTNTALYFLAGRLSEPLPEGEWLISAITELEVRSYPFATAEDESRAAEFLAAIPVCDLTPEVKALAVVIRQQKKLKLGDAIVAATSHAAQATLLTNDARLAQALGVRWLVPALKS